MARTDTNAPQLRHDREMIPRVMLRAMFGLVFAVLVIVTIARLTDRPLIATPPKGEISASREVLLAGDMAGSATIRTLDGELVADLSPEEGGFISGVWRVIQRERTKHRMALDGPVTLVRYENGRIAIQDPSTGWSADLMGFGADNARAFARLLAQ